MFMLYLLRLITGYVKFRAAGRFPERFMNLCATNGLVIWDPEMQDGVLYGYMSLSDYKKIRTYARAAKIRCHVLKRYGLIFVYNRYRHRIGIPIGTAVFAALLYLLSSCIWSIKVVGNESISSDVIMSQLSSIGVYEGVTSSSIDTENARQQLLINNTSLSWAAINISGCFITVDVREVDNIEQDTENTPCNIIADKGGVIKSIMARGGVPEIKVGEAVIPGDLLVSGIIELKTGSTVFVEADAEVLAEVEYKKEVFVPFKQTETVSLGASSTRCVLQIFNIKIPLFLGSYDKPCYIERETVRPNINGADLPIKLHCAYFTDTQKVTYTISEATAKKKCEEQMKRVEESELPDIVSSAKAVFTVEKDGVRMKKSYICLEDIAKKEIILQSD